MTVNCMIRTVLLLVAFTGHARAQEIGSFRMDGRERQYILYLPDGLPAEAPLVFVFHGYTGHAESTMHSLGMNRIADRYGFAVCYPQGTTDQSGNPFWQVGYRQQLEIEVDDVGFICGLAEHLQREHQLNRDHTFITGFSNGGDFCNLLLCSTSGIFRAAAPIISCIMKSTYDACGEARPVPIFMLNGTSDSVTYWEGDMEDRQGYGPYLSTPAMLEFRIRQTGCLLTATDTIRGPDAEETTLVVTEKYTNPVSGDRVWMYRYVNGGHGTPEYLNLAQEIWDFFSLYSE